MEDFELYDVPFISFLIPEQRESCSETLFLYLYFGDPTMFSSISFGIRIHTAVSGLFQVHVLYRMMMCI